MTFTCFHAQRAQEHWEMKLFENEGTDNTLDPHYNPAIKPSLVYLQCQSAQWRKLMEIDPKQINFPRAPHPGSQLPWISNVVACSEIKEMTRRQGQIKDTQFKATSFTLRCSLDTLDIHISHTCKTEIQCPDYFSGWEMGPASDSNQRSDRLPLPSPLSRYLAKSHSSAPPALQPK